MPLVPIVCPLREVVVRLHARRRTLDDSICPGIRSLLVAEQLRPKPTHHGPGDFVLDLKHVGQMPIVGLRPDVITGLGFHQLSGDPDLVFELPDAPLQDVIHPEFPADLSDVGLPFLEDEGRPGRHSNSGVRKERGLFLRLRFSRRTLSP